MVDLAESCNRHTAKKIPEPKESLESNKSLNYKY